MGGTSLERCGAFVKVPSASCTKAARRPPAFGWTSERRAAPRPGEGPGGEAGGRGHLYPDAVARAPWSQEENCAKIIKDPDFGNGPTWVQSQLKALMSFDL